MFSSLRISAPAKVNLFLHVTGKRADGYHLLDSLVAFTALGDMLEVAPAQQLSLTIVGPFAPSLPDGADTNLVMRAAYFLREYTGCTKGAYMVLHKHIPVGAGLGGGSSDAAAALIGLMQLWDVKLDRAQLDALALKLGSDVPVCLRRHMAWLRGTGEQVSAIEAPAQWENYWLVLANPKQPLLTADVFRKFSGAYQPPSSLPAVMDIPLQCLDIIRAGSNALETPAIALLPAIADILKALHATPDCLLSRMSGSGATCFGLYAQEASAQQAARDLQASHPGWWIQATSWYNEDQDKQFKDRTHG